MDRIVIDLDPNFIAVSVLKWSMGEYKIDDYLVEDSVLSTSKDKVEIWSNVKEKLARMLKDLDIRKAQARIIIPGQDVFTRFRVLPPVSEHKVAQLVKYEIQQQIPFALDAIVMDHQLIRRRSDGTWDVMMAATKQDIIDQFLTILPKGIKPVGVHVRCLCSHNWLKNVRHEDYPVLGKIAMITFSDEITEISFLVDGKLDFVRPIMVGVSGLKQDSDYDRLAMEIQRSIQYWKGLQTDPRGLNHILFTQRTSEPLKNIVGRIGSMPHLKGQLLKLIQISNSHLAASLSGECFLGLDSDSNTVDLIPSFGAALEFAKPPTNADISIDLLPKKESRFQRIMQVIKNIHKYRVRVVRAY